MRILGKTYSEGFISEVVEDAQGRVFFKGDMDIDADGANGQAGKRAAYMVGDKGSEYLANGGMAMRGGRVVGVQSWWRDICLSNSEGDPLVLESGVIPSKTAYYMGPGKAKDWRSQIDAETVPYIVVPPFIIEDVLGIVKGCLAAATYKGKRVMGLVADVGPRSKVGEASIAMARELGIPSSPRNGGIEAPEVLFELWPGKPGLIDGKPVLLMSSRGNFVQI